MKTRFLILVVITMAMFITMGIVAPGAHGTGFKLLYSENFNSASAKLGTFSKCAGDGDFRCAGAKGTRYYDTIGVYPNGWPDTATSGADGNGGRSVGGYYRPQDTVSVVRNGTDGQLRVRLWRPAAGGSLHVAAVVPRRCMNLRYGKFVERTIVRQLTPGYKMAHLRYTPNEIDYPEAGGNFKADPVSAFTHGFKESGTDVASNATWKQWHTYTTEVVPGAVRFYLDGKLKKSIKADFPDRADWVLQNESALAGAYAAPGSSVTIDTTSVACYSYSG